jgi:hypothetical protein
LQERSCGSWFFHGRLRFFWLFRNIFFYGLFLLLFRFGFGLRLWLRLRSSIIFLGNFFLCSGWLLFVNFFFWLCRFGLFFLICWSFRGFLRSDLLFNLFFLWRCRFGVWLGTPRALRWSRGPNRGRCRCRSGSRDSLVRCDLGLFVCWRNIWFLNHRCRSGWGRTLLEHVGIGKSSRSSSSDWRKGLDYAAAASVSCSRLRSRGRPRVGIPTQSRTSGIVLPTATTARRCAFAALAALSPSLACALVRLVLPLAAKQLFLFNGLPSLWQLCSSGQELRSGIAANL